MARNYQSKRKDGSSLATPKNDNKFFAYGALFRVSSRGTIMQDPVLSAFLLNPDSIEDSKAGNWIENSIPGQSDPILQWTSGGPRNLNFTALVTQDTAHFREPAGVDLADGLIDSALTAVGSIASEFAGINIPPAGDLLGKLLGNSTPGAGEELSIARHLDYYRSLMYPSINAEGVLTSSPPLVVLALGKSLGAIKESNVTGSINPGSYGSAGGTDLWVAKNVSIRITKWLPNLTPMEAEVTFNFVQYTINSRSSSHYGIADVEVTKSTFLPSNNNPLDQFTGGFG